MPEGAYVRVLTQCYYLTYYICMYYVYDDRGYTAAATPFTRQYQVTVGLCQFTIYAKRT